MAVSAAPVKLASSRNTQRKHTILPGIVGALWDVNLPRNLGEVGFDVGVLVETGISALASIGVPGGGQGGQSSHGAGGTRRQGRNRGCRLLTA